MSLTTADVLDGEFDVCVVGSGPAGLACALGCSERGLKVLLLEAGGERPVAGHPDVIAADVAYPEHHDPIDIVSAAALGGTSHWWGGCVTPFGPADFVDWPFDHASLASWYKDAAHFLGTPENYDSAPPDALAQLTAFDASWHEAWCPKTNLANKWRQALGSPAGPAVLMHARVVAVELEGERSRVRVRLGEREVAVRARHVVAACGGLGVLRLLLLAQRENPALFGGPSGPLGRGYMGHLTGEICDFAPADRGLVDAFGFKSLGNGVLTRRRIQPRDETITREGIGNVSFFLDDSLIANPAHGSAVASAKYLAVRAVRAILGRRGDPQSLRPHFENVSEAPFSAVAGLARAGYMLAMAQVTGRPPRSHHVLQVADGVWTMRFHAEQRSDPANRVSLSTRRDSIGLPCLNINFKFGDDDLERVVRAHELLDADLADAGVGRLKWRASREASLTRVRAQARDGYHQMGGAIMNADSRLGVVDADCRVHGTENLWLASSCVFPSGSHANPTLTIVALARRLAANLASVQLAAARTSAAQDQQAAEAR